MNKTLNFLGVGISLYALAGLYQYFAKDPIIKHFRKCPYCRKNINEKVCASTYSGSLCWWHEH